MQKDEIIAQTRNLLGEFKMRDFNLNTILIKLNISKGNFYYYFESKDDLIYQVISPIIKSHNEGLKKRIMELSSIQEQLRCMFYPLIDDTCDKLQDIENAYAYLFFEGNIQKKGVLRKLYIEDNKYRKTLIVQILKFNKVKITKEISHLVNYIIDTIMPYNIQYKSVYNKNPKKEILEFINSICSLILKLQDNSSKQKGGKDENK